MAGAHGSQVGSLPRQNHPGPVGEGAHPRGPAVSTARGNDFRPIRSFIAQGLFQEVKAIADTGFLVAFANRKDLHHNWAVEIARQVVDPLLTCEAVLAEATFHLGSSLLIFDFVRTGLVKSAFVLADHVPRLTELATRYQDRRPDLADLCLIRMSELNPNHAVITTDLADFRVYRRNRREVIPLICPPANN